MARSTVTLARTRGSEVQAEWAVTPRVQELLARSDGELVAADLAPDAGSRFVHAHLAALRAGAALLAATEGSPRRRAPRPVWELVAAVAPDLAGWTARFASAAPLRAAVENGRSEVDDMRADRAVAEATAFADTVRDLLLGYHAVALRVS